MRKASVLFVALALAMFGLAACGDDEGNDEEGTEETAVEETTATGGATLEVSSPSDGSLAYDQNSLTAEAGTVTLTYDNPGSTPHDVTVEDETGNEIGGTEVITGSTANATLDLQPGTYTFFCSVPGHRES